MTRKKIAKETLEAIEDDIQLKVDDLLEKVSFSFKKEATALKEEQLRSVCVDYAHVEASVIQDIYDRIVENTLSDWTSLWEDATKR